MLITITVAIHTVTGHRVAMKFISKQVINATKTRTRVQREVEYMRTLRHAHIIKLYVLVLSDGRVTLMSPVSSGMK